MKKLTPAQLEALRLVATGTVSYNEGLRDRGRFSIRADTINRSTMHALSRRGLTVQEGTDRFYRKRVVLTEAGREALAAATTEAPKETP
jgi:hypothetical protein